MHHKADHGRVLLAVLRALVPLLVEVQVLEEVVKPRERVVDSGGHLGGAFGQAAQHALCTHLEKGRDCGVVRELSEPALELHVRGGLAACVEPADQRLQEGPVRQPLD